MNKSTISYIMILVMLVVASIFSLNMFLRQRAEHDVVDIHKFPMVIGEWKGKDLEITEKEYSILETRNLIAREYTNPKGERVDMFIIYSETNRSVFHPPEVCLIGSGITITDKKPEKMSFDKKAFVTNKLFLEKGKYKEMVLYSYKVGNLYTDNYPLQQACFALSQLIGRRTQGATIRVTMPVTGGEKATLAALKEFLAQTVRIIETL